MVIDRKGDREVEKLDFSLINNFSTISETTEWLHGKLRANSADKRRFQQPTNNII